MSKISHSSSAIAVISLLMGLLAPFVVSAADANCLQRAVDRRSQDLRNAYQNYSNDMKNAVDRLTNDERHAIGNTDVGYLNADTTGAMMRFSYDVTQSWQNLSTTLMYTWDTYYRERGQCGFASVSLPSTNYNDYYNQNYRYRDSGLCLEQVLMAPPAGCNYRCTTDSNGCQQCRLSCGSSRSECNCPSNYAPVCTRDGRTYDNACLAVCDERSVWRYGRCN